MYNNKDLMDDYEIESHMSNKISQTMLPIYSVIGSEMSFVNRKEYSPIPDYEKKNYFFTPKKVFKNTSVIRRKLLDGNDLQLPGFAAKTKELISPFSIKSLDYAKLFQSRIKFQQHFFHFPEIRPKNPLLKTTRMLKISKYPDMVGSKKTLTLRKRKKSNLKLIK